MNKIEAKRREQEVKWSAKSGKEKDQKFSLIRSSFPLIKRPVSSSKPPSSLQNASSDSTDYTGRSFLVSFTTSFVFVCLSSDAQRSASPWNPVEILTSLGASNVWGLCELFVLLPQHKEIKDKNLWGPGIVLWIFFFFFLQFSVHQKKSSLHNEIQPTMFHFRHFVSLMRLCGIDSGLINRSPWRCSS